LKSSLHIIFHLVRLLSSAFIPIQVGANPMGAAASVFDELMTVHEAKKARSGD